MHTSQNPAELRSKLSAIEIEHRDLDEVISRLTSSPAQDELLLRRLKKRKLLLKDRMALLQRMLDPDMPA
ncbi:MAG: hypothetical protein OHK0026_16390 [Rhodocyclaceae bacterium]